MILFKYKNDFYRFFIYVSALLITLLIVVNVFNTKKTENIDDVTKSIITDNNENTSIYVEYPRFSNDNLTQIVTDYLYPYIKEFKKSNDTKVLDITYSLYYFDKYVNIVFNIENTLNNTKFKNILIDLSENKLAYITNIYDAEQLKTEILNLLYHKYQSDIIDKIINNSINNYTYIINESKIDVYFNDIDLGDIDYIPMVSIILDYSVANIEDEYNINKKYISFTYDDGPGDYTDELLNTLELHNSSATFFMLGNRMKNYENTVKNIYYSNSEIGSHSYSHKNLSLLNNIELEEDLSKTNEIFNEITSDNLKYVRPPYEYYNDYLLETGYKVVTWNIDPKDWLVRDSKTIYNNVIKNACDGCIVVMHDIYPETIEATKMLIPQLNEMGYEIVSISKLIELKGYDITENDIISSIK